MYISHPGTLASNLEIEELITFIEDEYGYTPDTAIGNNDYIEVFTDKDKSIITADIGNISLIKTAIQIYENSLF